MDPLTFPAWVLVLMSLLPGPGGYPDIVIGAHDDLQECMEAGNRLQEVLSDRRFNNPASTMFFAVGCVPTTDEEDLKELPQGKERKRL